MLEKENNGNGIEDVHNSVNFIQCIVTQNKDKDGVLSMKT